MVHRRSSARGESVYRSEQNEGKDQRTAFILHGSMMLSVSYSGFDPSGMRHTDPSSTQIKVSPIDLENYE